MDKFVVLTFCKAVQGYQKDQKRRFDDKSRYCSFYDRDSLWEVMQKSITKWIDHLGISEQYKTFMAYDNVRACTQGSDPAIKAALYSEAAKNNTITISGEVLEFCTNHDFLKSIFDIRWVADPLDQKVAHLVVDINHSSAKNLMAKTVRVINDVLNGTGSAASNNDDDFSNATELNFGSEIKEDDKKHDTYTEEELKQMCAILMLIYLEIGAE